MEENSNNPSQNLRFIFNPCPDCGDKDTYVTFYRVTDENPKRTTHVQARCCTCDWTTGWHNNVKECADEWNSTVIYE